MGRTRQPAGVAALPWNQWQLSRGMGGRLRLESVATLVWNTHITFIIAQEANTHYDRPTRFALSLVWQSRLGFTVKRSN